MAHTIFALSSGSGPCGVAVFRASGPGVRRALETLTGRALPPPRQAVLRRLIDPSSGEEIDSGLVLFFPGPDSFTGEDVAEFQIHGSLASIRGLSAALGRLDGLGMAAPGAFTERALHNGKMDLVAVESLSDLLAAETLEQARLARVAQIGLRQHAEDWRDAMLSALALTEAGIDFSDEADISADIDSGAEQVIRTLIGGLEGALAGYGQAERIRRGFRVALCGPPNAGKSSLLNALAQREVAIVSPIAGTTRDVIEVHLDLGGYPVILSDTAGLRESEDEIEQVGIERAQRAAQEADLVLWLSPVDDPAPCPLAGALVVGTKMDRAAATDSRGDRFVSVTTGDGLNALIATLGMRAQLACGSAEGIVVAQERQRREVAQAVAALRLALTRGRDAPEMRAEDLREALVALDRLTGRIETDEVLGAIFSRFCIGK